jgi:Bacterial Ig domain
VVSGPSNGQISDFSASRGTLTYTPEPGFGGKDSFSYRASNPAGMSKPATATIEVISNDFRFGKVKKNKRKGTAKLTVKVPGPGELDLAKTKKVKQKDKRADAVGQEKLRIKPRRAAKQKLAAQGKAKVNAKVTYTPHGGSPNTEDKKIKLVKR